MSNSQKSTEIIYLPVVLLIPTLARPLVSMAADINGIKCRNRTTSVQPVRGHMLQDDVRQVRAQERPVQTSKIRAFG